MDVERLRKILIKHEGYSNKPYADTVGKITIGVGRNLTDCGISDEEVSIFLDNDIGICEMQLRAAFPWWPELDDARQEVLVDMCFMGIEKLKKFRKMLQFIQQRDFDNAAAEILNSKWAEQVGPVRANDCADAMRSGKPIKITDKKSVANQKN